MKEYTLLEVETHNTQDDAWLVIDNNVYDITNFLINHPGGKAILLQLAGTDATDYFHELHRPSILEEYAENFKIGILI